ncbi:ShlB/FhaC/HecB family hemolysin secretion/activation protein [Trinickia sp.]|uniref:ShlB/FhaC/HecB family hemolysin secretion/activation protein n=1 Tax=Trinickia sp. TaxID=2571163 RepID=UPI003F7EC1BF
MASASGQAQGIAPSDSAPGAQIQRLQQQQAEAAKDLNRRPTVLSSTGEPRPAINVARLPHDNPCFAINELVLEGNEFDWLARALQPVVGQCVGKTALKQIQDVANNALIERGYVTSRVLIPEQSIQSGTLTLRVMPGRVGGTRADEPTIGWLRAALPTSSGAWLNQRDIDQGLENLRRLPSQADATFDIVPGAQPGDSELLLHVGPRKRWHAMLGVDNSGLNSTGKTALSGAFTYDSPFHLYDQLQIAGTTNANFGAPGEGNQSVLASYSVPIGYAMFAMSMSRSRYKQSVPGFEGPLLYGGVQSQFQANLSAVVFRNAHARTEAHGGLYRQSNRNTYDGVELSAQTRDIIGYELGLSHRHYLGDIVLSGGISWRASLPGLSKTRGLVLDEPNFNGKTALTVVDISAQIPFEIRNQPFSYRFEWKQQNALTSLMPADYFMIGTRYSVRGFNQQTTLAAESGWAVSNEWSWYLPTPIGTQSVYGAVDAGRVSGPAVEFLTGRTLIGAVLGIRGQIAPRSLSAATMNYDVSVGWPLSRPAHMGSSPTFLFQISSMF